MQHQFNSYEYYVKFTIDANHIHKYAMYLHNQLYLKHI